MSSIYHDEGKINTDEMEEYTKMEVDKQMELYRKMERELAGYGERLITDIRLIPMFPEPTRFKTDNPEREELHKMRTKKDEMLKGFVLKTYPGASPKLPALIQGVYSRAFYDKLWELTQGEWAAVLTERDPAVIEEKLMVNNQIVVFKKLFETHKTVWMIKWKGNITMINPMAGFGILQAQHPQIKSEDLGRSIIKFMNGRKLKNVLIDNITALLVGNRYQYRIIEEEDEDFPEEDQQYPIFEKDLTEIGIKTQHREGPIMEFEISPKIEQIQMNEYNERKEMAQKAEEMASDLIKMAQMNGSPVPDLSGEFNELAAKCTRRAHDYLYRNARLRQGVLTQGDVKLVVNAKTDQRRPVKSSELNSKRHNFYWIGKNITKYNDNLNTFYKLQIEVNKNGNGDSMMTINEYGAGTIAVTRDGEIVALPAIEPHSPWPGQIAAREVIKNNYFQGIVVPLQDHINKTMKKIQRLKICDGTETWTMKIDYEKGDIEVYEPSQVILAGDKENQNWYDLMRYHCREKGIFDHTHGDYQMDLYQNNNYEGLYVSSNGPKPAVKAEDERFWMEQQRLTKLAQQYQEQEEKERQNNQSQQPSQNSAGPGVERRLVLWGCGNQRPRPATPPNRDQRRQRMREDENDGRDQERDRSRSRERGMVRVGMVRVHYTNIIDFCREHGIDLDEKPGKVPENDDEVTSPTTAAPTMNDPSPTSMTTTTTTTNELNEDEMKQMEMTSSQPPNTTTTRAISPTISIHDEDSQNEEEEDDDDDQASESESESSSSQRSMSELRIEGQATNGQIFDATTAYNNAPIKDETGGKTMDPNADPMEVEENQQNEMEKEEEEEMDDDDDDPMNGDEEDPNTT